MAWNLSGELVESCSCNMMCPCWYAVPDLMVMDQEWCASPMLWRIGEGSSQGVDLSGRTVVVSTHFPGPTMFDGNATARVIVDDGASDQQRDEIESRMQGSKGGPMEVLGGLITTWLPTKTASMDVRSENGTVIADIGDFGHVESRLLKNEAGDQMTMSNTGFAAMLELDQTIDLAPSASKWSDPEMPVEFETKSGAVSRFSWSN